MQNDLTLENRKVFKITPKQIRNKVGTWRPDGVSVDPRGIFVGYYFAKSKIFLAINTSEYS